METEAPPRRRITRVFRVVLTLYGIMLVVFSARPEMKVILGSAKIKLGGFESTIIGFFVLLAIALIAIGREARRSWFLPVTRAQKVWTAFLVLLFTYAVYVVNNQAPEEGDTMTHKLMPLAILEHGDLTMEVGRDFFKQRPPMIAEREGVWLAKFPLGTGVMALPVYAFAEWMQPGIGHGYFLQQLEKSSAAWIAAISAVFFFFLCRCLFSPRLAWLGWCIFAFGTQQWAVSSQSLWQHGPSVLCLVLTLWLLTRQGKWIWLLGIPLVLACFVRPSNALWVLPAGLFALWRFRIALWPAVLIALPLAGLVVKIHLGLYGHLLGPYGFHGSASSWDANILHAGTGHLISASRGILVFMPLVLLVPWGCWLGLKDARLRPWFILLSVCLLLWWVMIVQFGVWYGGYCYGPRLQTELAPIYVLLILPLFRERRRILPLLILFMVWGCYMQWAGIYTDAAHRWNKNPSVQEQQERLWDWGDPQWLAWWKSARDPA